MGHRFGAILVALAIAIISALVMARHRGNRALMRPAATLIGLLLAQLTLGVLTVLWRKPADLASAHVAVGALVLVTVFVLLVRSARLYARRQARFETAHDAEIPAGSAEALLVA